MLTPDEARRLAKLDRRVVADDPGMGGPDG
jgi:hypothetical protein